MLPQERVLPSLPFGFSLTPAGGSRPAKLVARSTARLLCLPKHTVVAGNKNQALAALRAALRRGSRRPLPSPISSGSSAQFGVEQKGPAFCAAA